MGSRRKRFGAELTVIPKRGVQPPIQAQACAPHLLHCLWQVVKLKARSLHEPDHPCILMKGSVKVRDHDMRLLAPCVVPPRHEYVVEAEGAVVVTVDMPEPIRRLSSVKALRRRMSIIPHSL